MGEGARGSRGARAEVRRWWGAGYEFHVVSQSMLTKRSTGWHRHEMERKKRDERMDAHN